MRLRVRQPSHAESQSGAAGRFRCPLEMSLRAVTSSWTAGATGEEDGDDNEVADGHPLAR